MPSEPLMRVEVAYATPQRQWLLSCELPVGATIADAITASGILALCPGIDTGEGNVGVWSRVRAPDTVLADGDRVEIYRSLKADPKEVRRRRARESEG